MTMHLEHFEIRLSSDPRHLPVIRATVTAIGHAHGFDGHGCHQLALAVNEALVNVIQHGYGGRPDQLIRLRIEPARRDGREGLCLVIEDDSGPVDLTCIRSRPLDEIRPGGLGVHLIREMMDEVTYSQRDDQAGLRLTMCKYTPTAQTAANKESA